MYLEEGYLVERRCSLVDLLAWDTKSSHEVIVPISPYAQLAPMQVCHLYHHLLLTHQFPSLHF